MTSMLDST
jgi:hypothetical protein